MKAKILLAFLLVTVVALPGCILTGKSDQMAQDIAALKAQMAQLEQRQADLEEQFEGTAQKSAEAYLSSEQIQQEISILRGRYDEAGFSNKKYQKEVTGLRNFMGTQLSTVEGRLDTLEKKAGIRNSKNIDKLPSTAGAIAMVDTSGSKKGKPDDLYKEAYSAYKVNNLEVGKAKFRKFIQLYPKHNLADDSQFYLAECFFKQKDYENAILEYDKVGTLYPGSKWNRAAFLNLGFSFLNLGDKNSAKLFFEKVISDYPGTNEAKVAKKKLSTLK